MLSPIMRDDIPNSTRGSRGDGTLFASQNHSGIPSNNKGPIENSDKIKLKIYKTYIPFNPMKNFKKHERSNYVKGLALKSEKEINRMLLNSDDKEEIKMIVAEQYRRTNKARIGAKNQPGGAKEVRGGRATLGSRTQRCSN